VLLPHTLLHTDHAAMHPRPPVGPPAPPPAALGGAAGRPVMASFNRLLKIDEPTFQDWLRILRSVRPARPDPTRPEPDPGANGTESGRAGCWATLWLLRHGDRSEEAQAALARYAQSRGVRTVGSEAGPDGGGRKGAGAGPCLAFTTLAPEAEHIAEKVARARARTHTRHACARTGRAAAPSESSASRPLPASTPRT
jgi:hypothetical protein